MSSYSIPHGSTRASSSSTCSTIQTNREMQQLCGVAEYSLLILLDHYTLHLSVETPATPFVSPSNIHTIEAFMNRVGYQGVVDKLSAFFTKNLAQPWQIMFKDDVPLVSVYTTGNVLVLGMLIPDALLTVEIRETDDYKEYETVFMKLDLGDLSQLEDLNGKSSDTQGASNTLDPLSQKLEDENVSLEFQVLNYAKENAHLKTIYKNLFDSIKVTQAQTNSIIDSLQKQLYETIYENAKLRAQLFDKVSKQKGTTKGTRTNTMFTKQSILEKPPSSSYKPELDSVTPFPKSLVLPKVDKMNALSKPVTLNSASST
ncbi:hypothetical protein Tco_0536579 [Tanacetum coccineum]